MSPPSGSGCRCPRCAARDAPLGGIEAELTLRHVSDREAVLYALGAVAASIDGGGCPTHC
ncbi:hypothetical protein BST26_14525 [Mycolicibacterium insubricum]|uniref:Uncharacterized protein n=1 Tax=Mycolicibacterium insubricum TaxID=444597 RepID=A0A1X0D6X2_9MYCO|nr:hypothetical protein [Mycolicibacterium insubricum]MCV7080535.1 hypothetical protein [Mycolicibacterium insubricum]ORA68133.1 hypothetical protein BST26_14525 [Mycolicibacterium insubricum]